MSVWAFVFLIGLWGCGKGGSYSEQSRFGADPTPAPTQTGSGFGAGSYPAVTCVTTDIKNNAPNQLLVYLVDWSDPTSSSAATQIPEILWDMDVEDFENPNVPLAISGYVAGNSSGPPDLQVSGTFSLVADGVDLFGDQGSQYSFDAYQTPFVLPANVHSFTVSIDISSDKITTSASQVNTYLKFGSPTCDSCAVSTCSFTLHW